MQLIKFIGMLLEVEDILAMFQQYFLALETERKKKTIDFMRRLV